MARNNPTCNNCGVVLTPLNWAEYSKANWVYRCNDCERDRTSKWKKDHIKVVRKSSRLYAEKIRRQKGMLKMEDNKECAAYLGIYVAERVLSHVFKNVKRMPNGNHGYDFVCGKGYLIDIKASCEHLRKGIRCMWQFNIRHNTIADYFLCIAFDNREDLNPMYLWMIPSEAVIDSTSISISESTIHKWDEYRLDIDKVISCCNVIKAST